MIGEKVSDKKDITYTIDDEIGKGGFGTVYLAYNEKLESFAIKMIGPVKDAETLESFNRETEALIGIDNENVLNCSGQGEYLYRGGTYFFTVTEYCANGNYRKEIARAEYKLDKIVSDFSQILLGLDVLHQRVVHRDLKPENIMISGNILKIGDLGLSKSIDEATKTLTFKGSGTPNYMAPEVWERKKITPAADLYAIGVMLFEALTAQLPFSSDDFVELRKKHLYDQAPRVKSYNSDIPVHIDGLCRKLLEKDQSRRYQNAKDVLKILNNAPIVMSTEKLSTFTDRIRQNYDTEESKRLEAVCLQNEAEEAQRKNQYMEQQLISQFDDVVEEINENLQETKIQRYGNDNNVNYSISNHSLSIYFFPQNALLLHAKSPGLLEILNKRYVKHGGIIEIKEAGQDRQGWNMVLVQRPEDSYGEWILVESDRSALSGRVLRYPPAATVAELLAENLAYHWMPALHSWQLKDKVLEKTDIEKIFDKFIP